MSLGRSRWDRLSFDFCLDGLQNFGKDKDYKGPDFQHHQILIECGEEEGNYSEATSSEKNNEAFMNDSSIPEDHPAESQFHFVSPEGNFSFNQLFGNTIWNLTGGRDSRDNHFLRVDPIFRADLVRLLDRSQLTDGAWMDGCFARSVSHARQFLHCNLQSSAAR